MPIAEIHSAAPIPAKGAQRPATSAVTMATIGARNGVTHSRAKAGSASVPSHHVGLPMLRPVSAAEASAAVTRSHEMTTIAGHGFWSDRACRSRDCGTAVDTA